MRTRRKKVQGKAVKGVNARCQGGRHRVRVTNPLAPGHHRLPADFRGTGAVAQELELLSLLAQPWSPPISGEEGRTANAIVRAQAASAALAAMARDGMSASEGVAAALESDELLALPFAQDLMSMLHGMLRSGEHTELLRVSLDTRRRLESSLGILQEIDAVLLEDPLRASPGSSLQKSARRIHADAASALGFMQSEEFLGLLDVMQDIRTREGRDTSSPLSWSALPRTRSGPGSFMSVDSNALAGYAAAAGTLATRGDTYRVTATFTGEVRPGQISGPDLSGLWGMVSEPPSGSVAEILRENASDASLSVGGHRPSARKAAGVLESAASSDGGPESIRRMLEGVPPGPLRTRLIAAVGGEEFPGLAAEAANAYRHVASPERDPFAGRSDLEMEAAAAVLERISSMPFSSPGPSFLSLPLPRQHEAVAHLDRLVDMALECGGDSSQVTRRIAEQLRGGALSEAAFDSNAFEAYGSVVFSPVPHGYKVSKDIARLVLAVADSRASGRVDPGARADLTLVHERDHRRPAPRPAPPGFVPTDDFARSDASEGA